MNFDKYGFIYSEKDPIDDPGRIGDSTANTFRWLHLISFLGNGNMQMRNHARSLYELIKTGKGYLRHPDSIWREDDMSGDQVKPLLMGLDSWGLENEALEVAQFHKYFYGNGNLVHPTFKAVAARQAGNLSWFWDIHIYLQVVAMLWLPFRWNDEYWKQGKWPLERSANSTADWMNWIHMIIQAEEKGHTYWTMRACECDR